MKTIASGPTILASADGNGLISQAGGLLLVETLRITGLDRALSAQLGRWRPARAVHDPGKVITDLAVTLALGGDCLADIAMLRSQPELFGHVASDPMPAGRAGDRHGPLRRHPAVRPHPRPAHRRLLSSWRRPLWPGTGRRGGPGRARTAGGPRVREDHRPRRRAG